MRKPHGDPHSPIPGASWFSGRMGVDVHQGRRLFNRRADAAVFGVYITAPSDFPVARLDLEVLTPIQAIATARLMCVAPRLAQTLYDLDVQLENAGHQTDHPLRRPIREALEFATTVPLSCL